MLPYVLPMYGGLYSPPPRAFPSHNTIHSPVCLRVVPTVIVSSGRDNYRIQHRRATEIEHLSSKVGVLIISGLPEDFKPEYKQNVSWLN